MKVEGLRSPYHKDLYHLGRMLDKIRLQQAERLPAEYLPTTFDLIDLREGRAEHSEGKSRSPESPPPLRRR